MAECVTGKRMFVTSEMAEQALIDAWVKHDFPSGRGPVAIYLCADCKHYHLTSTGEMNASLSKFISEGKLNLQKEANYWLNKFRR